MERVVPSPAPADPLILAIAYNDASLPLWGTVRTVGHSGCLGSKGLQFALFHHLYTFPEGYKGLHRLAHRISTGWYSFELGNWALEVKTSDRTDRVLVKQWARLKAVR